MAKTTGLNGSLSFKGNASVGAYNMSIPQTIEKADSTVYGDIYRTHKTTLKSATASADCKLDTADITNFVLGDEGLLIMMYSEDDVTAGMAGTATLDSKNPTVPLDGIVTEALAFTFNGTFLPTAV
jgi:hypothetical protein